MTQSNTTVIYHRSDFDGIFCLEIARKFLPDAELIGWEYGDPVPKVSPERDLFILDLSVEGLMDHPRLVWIDHHKSAMEKYHHGIPGYRIDGVAACRLAWQWFSQNGTAGIHFGFARHTEGVEPHCNFAETLPRKDQFIARTVSEPLAVRLAGEYDIWDKRDPNAELFQHGLRSERLDQEDWDALLTMDETGYVEQLLQQGRVLQYAKAQENESIIQHQSFRMKWEGLNFLCCNHARFNSFLFTAGLMDDDQACLGFCWDGGKWKVSLYHAPGQEHHDLSVIAVKYGGGGHRGACGFTCADLPFSLKP